MKTLGNVIWAIFIGWEYALSYLLVGVLCCILIFPIPIGLQFFKLAKLAIWPFGREIVFTKNAGKAVINVLYAIFIGWWYALVNFVMGVALCCTLIGIPFGLQFFKFGRLVFMPLGASVQKKA